MIKKLIEVLPIHVADALINYLENKYRDDVVYCPKCDELINVSDHSKIDCDGLKADNFQVLTPNQAKCDSCNEYITDLKYNTNGPTICEDCRG